MSGTTQKRMFTAELRKKGKGAPAAASTESATAAPLTDSLAEQRHREIMDTLAEFRKEVAELQEIKGSLTEDYKKEIIEAEKLKRELAELSGAINDTKREIAALRLSQSAGDRLSVVTDELDTVTAATEDATDTILAAAEAIDDHTTTLRLHVETDHQGEVDDIAEQVVKIFEACNFQDVTGQRITKVVNTLRFVEERVESMMDILGGDQAFEDVEAPEEAKGRDERLLNGPQMEGRKINQDEIDALFD